MRTSFRRSAIAPIVIVLAGWSGSAAAEFPAWPGSGALGNLPGFAREDTRRLGDEVRGGSCASGAALAVLAPSNAGVTIASQPALYWFTRTELSTEIQIEIYDQNAVQPVLDTTISGGVGPGIHELSLARQGVSLEPGVEYEWSVAALCDPDDPAGDIVSAGTLLRIEPPADLERQLQGAGLEKRAELLVEHGIWYDALETLALLVAQRPDGDWRAVRAGLLDSVGLAQAAQGG